MSNRTKLLLQLSRGPNDILFSCPTYESTKGSFPWERDAYFERIHLSNALQLEPEMSQFHKYYREDAESPIQNAAVSSSVEKKYVLPKRTAALSAKRRLNIEEKFPCLEDALKMETTDVTSSLIEDSSDGDNDYVPSLSSQSSDASDESDNSPLTITKTVKSVTKKQILENKDINSADAGIAENITDESNCLKTKPTKRAIAINVSERSYDLTISVTSKHDNGKRRRDKRHCCYFCNNLLSNNMARHFQLKHASELEVAQILAKPIKSKERRDALDTLVKAGDFYFNCNILSSKSGELILVRRPNEEGLTYADFGPCPHCLGFMAKKYLWHHDRQCRSKMRPQQESGRGYINESEALLHDIIGPQTDGAFRTEIIRSFRSDIIGNECKEDALIIKLGSFLFEKYGNVQSDLIRQSMRQLARLKLELNSSQPRKQSLSGWLRPQYFDTIIQATKKICGNEYCSIEKIGNFNIPSLALKLGHLLRKCIALESGTALRSGSISRHKELKALRELMDLEWSTKISTKALTSLYRKKINSTQLLPLTSDLMKLSLYLQDQMKKLLPLVLKGSNKQLYKELATVTLSRIILFNKRRSGEASKMTLQNYATRPNWHDQGTEELKNSLTVLERELANRLIVIQIIGKRGRIVPVIITPDVKECIDVLILKRSEAEISSTNMYIFARGQNSDRHLRGHDCLKRSCLNAGLEKSENITSTKLRKYIATVCQIFDLKENECDWLARHLGHDIRVHRDFYRLHESAVELTKVSRLLIAVDKGEAQKFAGKSLEDINIDELSTVEEEDKEEDEEDMESEMQPEEIGPEKQGKGLPIGGQAKAKLRISSKKDVQMENDQELHLKKKQSVKRPWTKEELDSVLNFFSSTIKRGKVPGKAECSECKEKHPSLEGRSWTDIKFCVKNHISRIQKQKKN